MENQSKTLIERYIQAYNAFDVEGMLSGLHHEVIFENQSNGETTLSTKGIEQFKTQAEAALQYFTERQQQIESWEFNDQSILVNIDYKAVLAIDFPNGMKAGDALEIKGSSEFRFSDGKIIRIIDRS